MHDHAERVDGHGVEEDVDLDQLRGRVPRGLVVEAGVPLGARLHLVEEVDDDLRERQAVHELEAFGREVLHLHHLAPLRLAQVHQRARVLGGGEDRGGEERLAHLVDLCGGGHLGGVVDHHLVAGGGGHQVLDRGSGGDQAEVELPLEALADDLHVEQSQEAAPEPEPERTGGLGGEGEARVVEAELVERLSQVAELVALDRVEPAEHHRLGVPVALERGGRPRRLGDGLARPGLADVLDARDQVADLAGTELADGGVVGEADAHLLGLVGGPSLDELELGAGAQHAVDDPDRGDHAAVLVVERVEDQALQRGGGVARGGGDAVEHRVEQRRDPLPRLGADRQHLRGGDPEHGLDLGRVPLGIGRRQIDLVQRRDDLEVVLEGEVAIGERLRLDALGRVDEQDDPLARREGPRHLVAEVHVAGRVDEVDDVVPVVQPDALELDGDAALPLEVHRVEVLLAHLAGVDGAAQLEHPVGQGALAVVDVGDDRQVADVGEFGHEEGRA